MRRPKGLKINMKDNRGTTLVEVIVALLILVLIFTPAYMAFSAALKLNQASKDKLYAQTIAENAMEIIKYTMDTKNGSTSTVDFTPLNGVGAVPTVSGSSVRYELLSCPEGTSVYDVTINISDHEKTEADKQNFADMSAFNDKATALINPSGIAGGFDSSVVDYFSILHRTYYNSVYQDELARVNAANNTLLEDWNYDCLVARLAGNPEPPRPTLIDLPTLQTGLSDDDLVGVMRKQMKVSMEKVEGAGRTTCKLDSTMEYWIPDNHPPQAATLGVLDAASYAALPMTCDKYCDNVRYDELNNLYLMYTPLSRPSGDEITLSDEKITISNNIPASVSSDPINVFVVVQAPSNKVLKTTNGLTIEVISAGGSRPVKIYCNVDFTLSGTNASRGYDAAEVTKKFSLIDEEIKQEIIYDVEIDVSESGSASKTLSLNSTVTKK